MPPQEQCHGSISKCFMLPFCLLEKGEQLIPFHQSFAFYTQHLGNCLWQEGGCSQFAVLLPKKPGDGTQVDAFKTSSQHSVGLVFLKCHLHKQKKKKRRVI